MEIEVDETDSRGVMVIPGVFVDGDRKSTGRVPSKEEIAGWSSARLGDSEVTEAEDTKVEEPCACIYYLQAQAKMVKKEPSLYKLTCKECGISFSSNVQKDYCFDCEKKRSEE
jgi:hypothetical protein